MIPVHIRTNLDDVMMYEEYPKELPAIPNIGDSFESGKMWGHAVLSLKVVSITWKKMQSDYSKLPKGTWYAEIELHLSSQHQSISIFENWYAYIRGKIPQEIYTERYTKLISGYYDKFNFDGSLKNG